MIFYLETDWSRIRPLPLNTVRRLWYENEQLKVVVAFAGEM